MLRRVHTIAMLTCLLTVTAAVADQSDASSPSTGRIVLFKPARYELTLNASEFALLQTAAESGVSAHGGDAQFDLRIANIGKGQLQWIVTTKQARLLEVWSFWMAEQTTRLVNATDFSNLHVKVVEALKASQAVNNKLAIALASPLWDESTIHGSVSVHNGDIFVQTDAEALRITGPNVPDLAQLDGMSVVATGQARIVGEFDVTAYAEAKPRTLDLFVMSLCPFARRAEASILDLFEGASSAEQLPELRVHYMFTRKQDGAKVIYSAMHGEDEVRENLVQMTIRDELPRYFQEYLHRRAVSDAPWRAIAADIGLALDAIALIERRISADRDRLIEQEIESLRGYGVINTSPTFLWEGERVKDLKQIETFKQLQLGDGSCGDS
jgi:hypothetical protein